MGVVSLRSSGYCNTNQDLADYIRNLADCIEAGNFGENVKHVSCIIEDAEGKLHRQTCGGPCDHARAMGILALAVIREI